MILSPSSAAPARSLRALCLIALGSLLFAATAHAQWKTTTYTLKGGWNSIYLHGDASYASLETIFASQTAVEEIWRWNPNPTQVGFTASPLIPSAGTPEWSVWKRGSPAESSLSKLIGQMAYLVKCSGTSSTTYSVQIPQKVLPPSATWVRNGANLLGFPTLKNGSTYPTMVSYFANFPAAIASNAKIYKYVGGELGPGNPQQVFSTSSERLDRNQAYWFSAEVTSDYYSPIEISPSSNDGLAFGRDGSFIKVLVRNRSAAAVTLTLSPVDSESAPSNTPGFVGKVPLTKRSFNATSLVWIETPITASYTEAIGPSSTVELIFGINRGDALMTAASPGALFASLLRITDSSNLMEVYVPVTARASSLAGLWVGDVSLTNVSNKVSNGAQAKATLTDGVITGLTVVGSGGFGYTSPPAVTLAPPHANSNVTATATATIDADGLLTAVTPEVGGSGYLTSPLVTIVGSSDVAAEVTAILTNGTVTGYNVTAAGSGYTTAPAIILSGPPANAQATATATVANGSVTGFTVSTGGSGYEKAPAVTIDLPPPQTGSSTPTPFKLRTLLHLTDGGTARLLSEVYLGQLAVAPNDVGLCTSESLLKQNALASAQCFSSSHLPMDQVITSGGGSFATGQTLTRVINVPYNDATNPFVHAYHPDHDNKNARGEGLSAGVESPDITRTCQFIFTASPPAGSSVTSGWGSSVIGGNYIETMNGVHKDPLILSGTFELRRASQIGTLSQ